MRLGLALRAATAALVVAAVGVAWVMGRPSRASVPSRPPAPVSASVSAPAPSTPAPVAALPVAHPHVVEPAAGVSGVAGAPRPRGDAGASVAVSSGALAEPVSDAVIRAQLRASGLSANPNQATLTPTGLALAPIGAPLAVQQVIAAGNEIAKLPYVWGGGHGTYADTGYDCSGSISYVFAAAHLLDTTMVSGALAHWGQPGPGKWITVFANAGHTFMYVAGLRFDTVALAETGTRWSARSADEPDLSTFAIRHPAGM